MPNAQRQRGKLQARIDFGNGRRVDLEGCVKDAFADDGVLGHVPVGCCHEAHVFCQPQTDQGRGQRTGDPQRDGQHVDQDLVG